MKRIIALVIVIAVVLSAAPALAAPPADTGPAKVTICHATSSASNPWVVITIAERAWAKHQANHLRKNANRDELLDRLVAPGATAADCGIVIG